GGSVDFNPWLVLGVTAVPNTLTVGQMANVTADLTINSDGVDTHLLGTIPDGTPVTFAGAGGTVAPPTGMTVAGKATTIFTATTPGAGSASATVDAQTVMAPITISAPVFVFTACLQDDSNSHNVFLGNASTGAYQFCCNGTTVTGTATVTKRGNVVTFQDLTSGRRVLATVDGGLFKGTASLQMPPGTTKCTISDRDTRNN